MPPEPILNLLPEARRPILASARAKKPVERRVKAPVIVSTANGTKVSSGKDRRTSNLHMGVWASYLHRRHHDRRHHDRHEVDHGPYMSIELRLF
jgi:hypothetical protein